MLPPGINATGATVRRVPPSHVGGGPFTAGTGAIFGKVPETDR